MARPSPVEVPWAQGAQKAVPSPSPNINSKSKEFLPQFHEVKEFRVPHRLATSDHHGGGAAAGGGATDV